LSTRLRAPAYPHQTLTVDGEVIDAADGRAIVHVCAATEEGVHAEADAYLDVAST
jgi:hypothetical protein